MLFDNFIKVDRVLFDMALQHAFFYGDRAAPRKNRSVPPFGSFIVVWELPSSLRLALFPPVYSAALCIPSLSLLSIPA